MLSAPQTLAQEMHRTIATAAEQREKGLTEILA